MGGTPAHPTRRAQAAVHAANRHRFVTDPSGVGVAMRAIAGSPHAYAGIVAERLLKKVKCDADYGS
jgi:hypothetical protein